MSETVTGYIDHVIFRNDDNGYTVMVLKGMEEEQELTCVGTFPAITQGASIEATGNYITHPVYGKQFQISSYTEKCRKMRWQWRDIWDPEQSRELVRHLRQGSCDASGMIPCGLWRKNRSGWRRLKASVRRRHWRSPNR